MIRPAREDDYDGYAVLHKALVPEDPVPSRERYARELATIQVAEDAGRVAGYVDMHLFDDTAHVRNLVVGEDVRQRGIGTALMHAAAATCRARGVSTWQLNVDQSNAAAIALYLKLGFQFDWQSASIILPWVVADTLPAEPAPASEVALAAGPELETTFGLLRGRIANLLTRPGRVLVQLRDDARPIAFAAYEPAFPGASVFRVARPALAGTLLAALRPYKLDHDYLMVLVEGDDALAALIENAGGIVRRRIRHMTGLVPACIVANARRG